LIVTAAAVFAVLLSATSLETVEANLTGVVDTSLRGGRRALVPAGSSSYLSAPSIQSRRAEDADAEAEGDQQQQEDNDDAAEEEQEEEQQEEEEEEVAEEENANEMNNANMNDDGNAYGNDDQSDIVTNVQESWGDLMNRFDEDVGDMWQTSPSEWDEEHWKVFGIVGGIFTILLSCVLYMCCLCCSGSDYDEKDMLVATQSQADERKRKKNAHRGRLFTRSQSGDTHEDSLHNGHKNWESPFVLIEDVDKNDTFDQTALTNAGMSTAYTRGTDIGMTPMSSKTDTMNDFSTRALASPASKHTTSIPANPTASIDDVETRASRATSHGSRRRRAQAKRMLKEPSRGIVSEAVDVWSEFLGFKKSKYTLQPEMSKTEDHDDVYHDEDDDINLTDDEKTRRKNRSRYSASSNTSSQKKSKKSNDAEAPGQMRTGTYTSPEEVDMSASVDPVASEEALSSSTQKLSSIGKTTIDHPSLNSSSLHNNPRISKANSPRRTALLKTKNLLRSFGGSSHKTKHKNTLGGSKSGSGKVDPLLNDTADS